MTQDDRKLAEDALALASKATEGPWEAFYGRSWAYISNKRYRIGEVKAYSIENSKVSGDTELMTQSRQLVPDLATRLLAALDRVDELTTALELGESVRAGLEVHNEQDKVEREALKVEITELKENNFHWDNLEESNVCGFCGSHDQRTGGIKAHIRNNHIEG